MRACVSVPVCARARVCTRACVPVCVSARGGVRVRVVCVCVLLAVAVDGFDDVVLGVVL